ncbi:MAG TPA: DNA sulfur modification protein DndD [Myxococcaceae bacterium]|jgi:DNA sulfur modification protein DndD
MILEELILHNFGIYRERQVIDLAPRSPNRPIILFGGLNGSGKTTLLDAIKLVLYGRLADCSNRRELSYDEFLRRSIHRAAAPEEGATIELRFLHRTQGEDHVYRVIRSWRATPRTVRESVEVLVDGKKDPVLTEHWADQVESFIPARLSKFFFFDGEKIETLADFERAAEVLRTALQSLLGLDLVDQLQTDLKVVVRRSREKQLPEAAQAELEAAKTELDEIDARCAKAAQERASKNNAVVLQRKHVDSLEEKFRESGGELFLKRAQLEAEKRTLDSKLEHARERLRELAHGAAPLLLVRGLLDEISAQAASPATRLKEQLLSVLDERDAQLLAEARRAGAVADVLVQLESFLRQDREQRRPSHAPSPSLKLTDESHLVLEGLRGSVLAEAQATADLLLNEAASLNQALQQVERQLALVPDEEDVKGLSRKLDKSRQQLADAVSVLQSAEEALQTLNQERTRKHEAYAKRMERELDQRLEQQEVSRIIEHAQGVGVTMAQFRTRVVERHIRRIEQLILEGFTHLLRKESLVSQLTIDPSTYNLTLFGSDGKPLSPERLSAGERQLLAISTLWGLARAAGRPLPLVIDTPLGRLDSTHRKNLVERYFPVASHQVLLLSTDEEIDEGGLEKLRSSVGHTYRMVFDKREGGSRIEKGYFW